MTRNSSLSGVLVFCCLLMLVACGVTTRHSASGRVPRIGFSADTLVEERWKRDFESFNRAARDLGAVVSLEIADEDPLVQEAQIRGLVRKGIDVLVIIASDADRMSKVVREVKAEGIPVMCYDRLVRRGGADLYISFDNEKVGSMMASALVSAVPAGGYLIINGGRSDNNAVMLNEGFHRSLQSSVAEGKIKVVSEIWPANWDSDEVKTKLETLTAQVGHIDAVICGNDMLAEVAIGFLSENQRMGRVRVAGQDADLAACQRIAEGSQYATIYKPIDRLALKAAGFAVMLANGEKIETDAMIDDGAEKIPYVRLEPVLVTKDLLGTTVIKDGFHTAAEVYRNLP